jgi:hypothetical protein
MWTIADYSELVRLDLNTQAELVGQLQVVLVARREHDLVLSCRGAAKQLALYQQEVRVSEDPELGPELLQVLERRLARSIACVFEVLDAVGVGEVRPHAARTAQMRRVLFPHGLQAHLTCPRRRRARWNLRLVHVAAEPMWRNVCEITGLNDLLPQLEEDAVAWWRVVEVTVPDRLTLRRQGAVATLRLLKRIRERYDLADPVQRELALTLMLPVWARVKVAEMQVWAAPQGLVLCEAA